MNKIYIVTGGHGEYSDSVEWNIAAYADPVEAEEHRVRAETEQAALFRRMRDMGYSSRYNAKNKYDPKSDATLNPGEDCGIEYGIAEVEFREKAPE